MVESSGECKKTSVSGRRSFTFQSNIQEGISLKEIIFHLQPAAEKKKIIGDIVKERESITKMFTAVSSKLAYSFVYCLPRKANMSKEVCYEDLIVKAIFKLAVLYDVYTKALPHAPDMKVESLFHPVVAVVERAKLSARRQRDSNKMNGLAKSIIDEIIRNTLKESSLVGRSFVNARSGSCAKGTYAEQRALSRYRALLGLGEQAISKSQLFKLVSDLVRSAPLTMNATAATMALDEVLGISQRLQPFAMSYRV